jgi:hypothetical protein
MSDIPFVFTDTFSAIAGSATVINISAIDFNFILPFQIISCFYRFNFVRDDFSFSHREIIKKSNTFQYFFDLFFEESRKGQTISK